MLSNARLVNADISASTAAGHFEVNVPCLLLGQRNSILTLWDIIMKGLMRIEKDGNNYY
jgi:hypothetical protein